VRPRRENSLCGIDRCGGRAFLADLRPAPPVRISSRGFLSPSGLGPPGPARGRTGRQLLRGGRGPGRRRRRTRWLIKGLCPADAYGVLAAQEKAGKTWAALDLAVSVATGRPWLDHFACPSPGPVLVFLGEGGERATVRRIEAIATAKGVDPDQLADRLRLCFRVPRLAALGAGLELTAIQAELQAHPAALVVLDPLYLAAAGASGSNLYDMGAVLQAIQAVCQHAGCALVVTHWNKTGDGRGADRISGAGPAAWARVICSIAVPLPRQRSGRGQQRRVGCRGNRRGDSRNPLSYPPPRSSRRSGRPGRPARLPGRGPARRRRSREPGSGRSCPVQVPPLGPDGPSSGRGPPDRQAARGPPRTGWPSAQAPHHPNRSRRALNKASFAVRWPVGGWRSWRPLRWSFRC
jgi:hypothetical protein